MNEKWWSILVGIVMAACAALFVVAPFVGWWMPTPQSEHAPDIDYLYYIILGITGFFFILTEAILVYFMFRYGSGTPAEARTTSVYWPLFQPIANVFNTPKKIEIAWTIVPAAILLWIAFAQVGTWAEVKYKSRLDEIKRKGPELPLQVDISARQFEWRMRYPSRATWADWKKDPSLQEKWVRNPNFDDVHVVNELHCVKDRHVVIQLSTKDVLHSFNSPHMRVKQDALPGKTLPVWFKPIASNVVRKENRWDDGDGRDPETGKPKDASKVWEIACAELCGWGHYRMVGLIYVHESEEDFLAWLDSAAAKQNNSGKPDR